MTTPSACSVPLFAVDPQFHPFDPPAIFWLDFGVKESPRAFPQARHLRRIPGNEVNPKTHIGLGTFKTYSVGSLSLYPGTRRPTATNSSSIRNP